jgi:hypothetical protein
MNAREDNRRVAPESIDTKRRMQCDFELLTP